MVFELRRRIVEICLAARVEVVVVELAEGLVDLPHASANARLSCLFITTSRFGRIAVAPTAEKRITHDASPHKHESPRNPGRNRKASPHAPPRRFRATIAHRHEIGRASCRERVCQYV